MGCPLSRGTSQCAPAVAHEWPGCRHLEVHPDAPLVDVVGFTNQALGDWACRHLSFGTVVHTDALACFAAVKAAGCVHRPTLTGGGVNSVLNPNLTWINTLLGNIKRSLHGTHHHVSSKHLPRYLAEFSYRFNRRFQLDEMLPPPAYVALRTPLCPIGC